MDWRRTLRMHILAWVMFAQAGCDIGDRSCWAMRPLACEFVGVVESVALLGDYEGELYIADFDPCFVVTVRLREPLPALVGIPGQTVHFGIQSPAMLFRGELDTGQAYRFRLWRPADDEESGYYLSVIGREQGVGVSNKTDGSACSRNE